MLLDIFKIKGSEVPIVSSDATVVSSTAGRFASPVSKLSYLFWLAANYSTSRVPVETVSSTGTVAAGTLNLNFNSLKADIIAYKVAIGFSDQTAPGNVNFSHAWTDDQGQNNTFEFEIAPDFSKGTNRVSTTYYLASAGVGAKYYPVKHRSSFAYAVDAAASTTTTNAFTIQAPNDVRVTIIPIIVSSTDIFQMLHSLPKAIFAYIRGFFSKK